MEETAIIVPLEILEEIICRLPVEAFHRFRCTASTYNALVSEYRIARKHLSYATKHENTYFLSLTSSSSSPEEQHLRACPLSSIPARAHQDSRDMAINLPNREPVIFLDKNTALKLHPHGLLCLDNFRPIFVYNLSSGTRTRVPEPPNTHDYLRTDTGIGYDSANDDYMVIRLSFQIPCRVWIYSLKGEHWRCVAKFPYMDRGPSSRCIFADGRFHWTAKAPGFSNIGYSNMFDIVSFDPTSSEFELTQVPGDVGQCDSERLRLVNLRGRVCIYNYYGGEYCSMWETPFSSGHRAWAKVFSVPFGLMCSRQLCPEDELQVRPLYMYESGEVLIITVLEQVMELIICSRDGNTILYREAITAPDDGSFMADGIVHEGSIEAFK